MNIIKKMSVFPNGEKIHNDKLVHCLQIVYTLMESYDGRSILYLMVYRVRYGKNSRGALSSKLKDYRGSMHADLGLVDSRGRISKDMRNMLIYLDAENDLLTKLHRAAVLGKRYSFKMTLTLDQYDPDSKTVFKAKDSIKAYRDEDFKLPESVVVFLKSLGRD